MGGLVAVSKLAIRGSGSRACVVQGIVFFFAGQRSGAGKRCSVARMLLQIPFPWTTWTGTWISRLVEKYLASCLCFQTIISSLVGTGYKWASSCPAPSASDHPPQGTPWVPLCWSARISPPFCEYCHACTIGIHLKVLHGSLK